MIRWVLVVFVVLLLIQGVTPWLSKLGFGRFPGDLRFKIFGREFFIPITTMILLSAIFSLAAWIIGRLRH